MHGPFHDLRLQDMFAGGTETIATTLAWAMSELVRSPEIMAKAQQEVREVLGEDRAVITNSLIVISLNSTTQSWSSRRSLGCIRPLL